MNGANENPEPKSGINWPATLAVIFLFLFAIFWSLGPFFFWVLLSMAGYFGFLALYTSSSIKNFFTQLTTQFRSTASDPSNPYQAFRSRQSQPRPSQTTVSPQKVIRIVVIFFGSMFLFFFTVGIFATSDDETPVEETSTISEEPADDHGNPDWNEKGNAALQNDLYDSAHYYYDQALQLDPQDMYALYNKGLAYILHKDYQRGNQLARRCVAYHPDYDPAWWLLGYSYDLINYSDSSLYCLERANADGYTNPDFLQLLAEVYVKKGRNSEALTTYQKLVEFDTTKAEVWQKMAELDPAHAEAYLQKARALSN